MIFVFPDISNALINPLIFIASPFSKSSIDLFSRKSLYFSINNLNDLIFVPYFSTVGVVSATTVLSSSSSFLVAAFGCAIKLCLFNLNFDAPLIIASVIF